MAEEQKLFTRKATGLVRSIGISTAVIIALCNVVGLGWQKKVFQAAGWAPIPDNQFVLGMHPMVMAFLLIGILVLISVYCFAVLSAAMPKSGGGYIFISRILSPRLGFIATWLQFWSVAVSYGIIAVAVMEVIVIFGGRAGVAPETIKTLSNPWLKFALGAFVIILFSGIASFGIKQTGRLLHVIFWIPVALMVVVYILFISATPETMEKGVQAAYHGYSATDYTRAALLTGMATEGAAISYWGAVATAIIAAYFAFIGYASATFVAGEVKEAHKTLPKALFISGIAIVIVYMSIATLLVRAGAMAGKQGDYSLLTSVAYINYHEIKKEPIGFVKAGRALAEEDLKKIGSPAVPAVENVLTQAKADFAASGNEENNKTVIYLTGLRDKLKAIPESSETPSQEKINSLALTAWKGLPEIGGWMPFMADIQATGMGINWMMIVLVIFAAMLVANDIPPFILTSSRMIFAMAFDGVLPKSLAKVSPRWHSPTNAIIFVSAVSLFGAAAEAEIFRKDGGLWLGEGLGDGVHKFISSNGVLTCTGIWDAIFFTFCALACAFFPIRKAGIFEKSPFRAGKTFVITMGIIATLGNLALLCVLAAGKDGWNLLNLQGISDAASFLFSIALILVGILIYQYYGGSAKRTGVELTTVFTEIPPD
jgi:amino acid transporter